MPVVAIDAPVAGDAARVDALLETTPLGQMAKANRKAAATA